MLPMARRRPVGLLLAVLLAAACGGTDAAPSAGTIPATNATEASLLPTTADALPAMAPAGYEALLGELRGTPVVVNVWASWCGPCLEEAPRIAEAVAANRDVQFLGVDILDTRDGARAFIAEQGWTHPSVFDRSGAIRDDLGVLGQPVTLFYGADGALLGTFVGAIPQDELDRRIAEVLGA